MGKQSRKREIDFPASPVSNSLVLLFSSIVILNSVILKGGKSKKQTKPKKTNNLKNPRYKNPERALCNIDDSFSFSRF